jgi:hypothetical protein
VLPEGHEEHLMDQYLMALDEVHTGNIKDLLLSSSRSKREKTTEQFQIE